MVKTKDSWRWPAGSCCDNTSPVVLPSFLNMELIYIQPWVIQRNSVSNSASLQYRMHRKALTALLKILAKGEGLLFGGVHFWDWKWSICPCVVWECTQCIREAFMSLHVILDCCTGWRKTPQTYLKSFNSLFTSAVSARNGTVLETHCPEIWCGFYCVWLGCTVALQIGAVGHFYGICKWGRLISVGRLCNYDGVQSECINALNRLPCKDNIFRPYVKYSQVP